MRRILPVVLFLSLLAAAMAKEEDKKQLPCDDLQRCLSAGSRACWKRFYEDGRKKEDLIGDVLKVCPEADFLGFVDEAEAEMWPEFLQMDKNLTECMTESGLKVYVDFCSNMRSSKFPDLMEKAIEAAEKASQKPKNVRHRRDTRRRPSGDQGYKCWVTTMDTCAEQYKLPNAEIDKAMEKCEKDLNAVHVEERLGFDVGKRVMLKIVEKIKEAFDKEEKGDEDPRPTSPTDNSTKPESKPKQY